jgi:hypothetical protein
MEPATVRFGGLNPASKPTFKSAVLLSGGRDVARTWIGPGSAWLARRGSGRLQRLGSTTARTYVIDWASHQAHIACPMFAAEAEVRR